MRKIIASSVAGLIFCIASAVNAQDFYVYPAKGQSPEQTEKDKFECYNWAKNETGFDPMQMPTATRPPPQKEQQKAGALGGAAAGAAAGAITSGILGGDVGAGAAVGAVGGGLIGGMRRNDQRQREAAAQQQWEQEQAQNYAAGRSAYNRAYVACLDARGYSVK